MRSYRFASWTSIKGAFATLRSMGDAPRLRALMNWEFASSERISLFNIARDIADGMQGLVKSYGVTTKDS